MSTTNRTSCPHPGPTVTATTNTTSCSIVSAKFYAKTEHESTTRCNDRTITSSLQQRVTHTHEVQNILQKPVQPVVTAAPQLAA